MVYIDDWLIMGQSEEVVRRNMEAFDSALTKLGFKLHPTKREGPVQAIEYIGFLLDLAWARLSITGEKREKLKAHVEGLLASVSKGEWEVAVSDTVVGKLGSVAQILPGGRAR